MYYTGIVFNFSFRIRPLYRYFRVSSTTTATVTTPYSSSRLVGDVGSPFSRATAVRKSRCSGVTANASLLISVFRFFFAQPDKMVWITADDQVWSLYDRDRAFLLCYDLLQFAFILKIIISVNLDSFQSKV